MRVVMKPLLLTGFVVLGCGESDSSEAGDGSSPADSDEASVFSADVGDCIWETEEMVSGDTIASYTEVSCDDDHHYEIFALADYDGDTYDESAIGAFAQSSCGAAFEPYTGSSLSDTQYEIVSWIPTPDSFAAGDREVVCLLQLEDGSAMTGSASSG